MTGAAPTTCSARSADGRYPAGRPRLRLRRPARRASPSAARWANVKPMRNRTNVPAFSTLLYRYRNLVERFFNKLKHFRAVATRYDKRDDNYLAAVKLASIRIWMRFNELMA